MSDLPLITSEAFSALEPEWAALHARVPGATPFLHPAWHAVWLRHFGGDAAPVFLAIRREAELIGVAALDMDRDLASELGDHNVRDYAGPLALPGEEDTVAAGILEWLREDLTPAATFWGLPADAPMTAAIERAAALGWSLQRSREAVCPGVDLAEDFEGYVAALAKKDRHELRRKLRNLEAAGTVEFESVTSPEAVVPLLDRFLHFMRISRDDKDEFLTPAMEAFFRDLASTFSALGMLRLSTLSLDGQAIAIVWLFEDEGAFYLYNSGYDPAFGHLAAGLLSKAHAIRDACGLGKKRFDFLRGEEDYKRRLGGSDRELVTLALRSG